MVEVFAILIALGALIVGILGIGWVYGDFRPRSGDLPQETRQEQNTLSQ